MCMCLCMYIREIREEGISIKVIGEEINALYINELYICEQSWLWFSSAFVIAGLGEQCFQDDTCQLHDKHAVCAQVDHNAICKCKQGYHIVTVSRPTNARSSFCSQGECDYTQYWHTRYDYRYYFGNRYVIALKIYKYNKRSQMVNLVLFLFILQTIQTAKPAVRHCSASWSAC